MPIFVSFADPIAELAGGENRVFNQSATRLIWCPRNRSFRFGTRQNSTASRQCIHLGLFWLHLIQLWPWPLTFRSNFALTCRTTNNTHKSFQPIINQSRLVVTRYIRYQFNWNQHTWSACSSSIHFSYMSFASCSTCCLRLHGHITLVASLIHPHLDYCNSLRCTLTANLHKLLSLQNSLSHVILPHHDRLSIHSTINSSLLAPSLPTNWFQDCYARSQCFNHTTTYISLWGRLICELAAKDVTYSQNLYVVRCISQHFLTGQGTC